MLDAPMEGATFGRCQTGNPPGRTNPGVVQRFVNVNIPQTGHDCLIEQGWLDPFLLMSGQDLIKSVESKLSSQRFRSITLINQPLVEFSRLKQLDKTQRALIIKVKGSAMYM